MARTIAGIDIGAEIFAVFGGDDDGSIRYVWYEEGVQPPDLTDAPPRTPQLLACNAYPHAVKLTSVPESLMRDQMVVFGIYRDSIDVQPRQNDAIQFGDSLYSIYEVTTDSTQAVWVVYTQLQGPA